VENVWKKALTEGKEVIVNVRPVYQGNSSRPVEFEVDYTIDGVKDFHVLTNYEGGKPYGK
jgi:hypothetical protein